MNYRPGLPEVTLWCIVGSRTHVIECLPSLLSRCTYPNLKVLVAHEGHPASAAFIEGLADPRVEKMLFPRGLPATKYAALLERSGPYFMNICDDWFFETDPGPMFQDAVTIMELAGPICMVRISSHTPVFLDILHWRFLMVASTVGPLVVGMGLTDCMSLISKTLPDTLPDLWPPDTDFWQDQYKWTERVKMSGRTGATMLRYWGAACHVGTCSEGRPMTAECALSLRETKILRKYGLFGLRPNKMLYSTALNEEQRREFVYPLYQCGVGPLVPNFIPVEAQDRLGPSEATRIV